MEERQEVAKTDSQIFAFLGTDEARVKEDALRLARQLTPPENVTFGLEIVHGAAESAEHAATIVRQVIEGIQTLPFFGGDKTVWLQGASFLAENLIGKTATAQAAVDRLAATLEAGLPPGVSFILTAAEIDKRRGFYKKLSTWGKVVTYDLPDTSKTGWQEECMQIVQRRAGLRGMKFDPRALDLFVALTGENSRTLDMEIDKLSTFIGGAGVATEEDIYAVVAQTRAGIIFEIGDALAQRQLPRTLELIDRQLRNGESPISILLAAIVPRVRSLLVAREFDELHGVRVSGAYGSYQTSLKRLPESATAHLPRNKDGSLSVYPVFLAAKACHRFSLSELKSGLRACLEANLKLVTTQTDQRTVLSHLVINLLKRPASSS
ncbi:MAG: DNA polymerase-3 subunit delta [Verrucomicrobia bacterium]|nr:MAG: DNA polymerase-3 subunit delta [Verrucomicrobiota bacterium]